MTEPQLLAILLANLEDARQRATEWYKAGAIKGAVLVVSYIDVTNPTSCGAAYVRPAHIGENAEGSFVEHLVCETAQNHKKYVHNPVKSLHFFERSDRIPDRIIVEGDGKRFDIVFVAWGCSTREQAVELIGILKHNLK